MLELLFWMGGDLVGSHRKGIQDFDFGRMHFLDRV
jgi:hypothetical protein